MIVIFWRGLGYLVAVIVFGLSLAGNLLFNALYGEAYYDNHKWPFALSLLCSALCCWFLGNHLRKRFDRVAIDKQMGKEIVTNQSRHTFLFIAMHWWAPILAGIGLVLLGLEFVK